MRIILLILLLSGCSWMGNKSARSYTPATYQLGGSLDTADEQARLTQRSLASGSVGLRGVSEGIKESRTLSQRIDDKAVVVLKHWK